MKHLLDIDTWARKEHYEFFSRFEEPFFGVCVDIDCSIAWQQANAMETSFFLLYLHRSLVAANEVTPFRYRINDGKVWVYDSVGASPTINRPDSTFGFGYMDYYPDYATFSVKAAEEVARVRNSKGLVPAISGENVIHYSALPWIDFSAVSHARAFSFPDSCPKISFGKMTEVHGRKRMSMSVHVHHGLMDGFHVGNFIDLFQQKMNDPLL